MAEPNANSGAERAGTRPQRARTSDSRIEVARSPARQGAHIPAAGAHAAGHLVNEDATPGAGALPSHAHASGREVDGAAG